MKKFLYVQGKTARDELLKAGYTLLKSNDRNNLYIFENNQNINFDLKDNNIRFVESDTMTF